MNAIEFKNVTKSFQDGDATIEALKNTNFSVKKGEFVAIIGPSGSGKSTFLTIAGGLQAPSDGEVLINGKTFSGKKEKERAKLRFDEIGFILQSSNLVPFLSVKNQLKLVDKVSKSKAMTKGGELLKQLGVASLVNKYPEELSGGERQRVAIVRALYHDPTIILADEPTASLDTDKAFEVVKILAEETKEKNKATIMVTHDLRLVDYCDKVYLMEDGVLREKQ
ncbi:MAG: ABC transporter ATP-binding protein [Lactococcus raffinolactis]|jgi:putative ABC transport system ATP-binding protein|uniref:Putative hemin import ATP-binding protein HrtA n=1 Tax=Pseudolactococcus raffinolactis TaxID=1366 RepID=A0A2A5SH23_9LACT|nr:ABC transporter ATP-binding protein [Lactococcus raffinolactis]MBP6300684.1 ABC transporter ATP-binding protein [Lactococcus sp.]MBR2542620.1 ABC transporter ATP-binding protein [Lactococcus sp.]MBW9297982.1 ABC transporter ATP-binding protein [Lactococcus raffinolactis]MBW9331692.1 ABC transporter ATP-binding protein [Lactococcus raffinolactis]MCH4163098.1 ABC transporter ATP-binding protein [Lactococcus raffinolactis]